MKGYKGFNAKLQCTPSGKVFQPDTFYTLKDGKFTEAGQ